MTIEEAVEQIPRELEKRGTEHARCESEYENLDKQREQILSKIMNDIEAKTESEKRRRAMAHESYEIHLAALKTAHFQAIQAKAFYEATRAKLELMRSANAKYVALAKL